MPFVVWESLQGSDKLPLKEHRRHSPGKALKLYFHHLNHLWGRRTAGHTFPLGQTHFESVIYQSLAAKKPLVFIQ